ncbi:MAG TPA: carbohydrate ABC transporter permease [Chloroflexia bacterium]|jgi:glucose/mannose transport system permease protein|nr:carbohydrate ABC transporter permease [Chloroflexia bacterium]
MSTPPIALQGAVPEQRKFSISRLIVYLLLVIFAVFFLVPIYVAIVTALKTTQQVATTSIWEPTLSPYFENFGKAFDVLGKGFGNSLLLAIPSVIISSMLGSMNGYVLSKWTFKGSNLLFTFMLFGMFIPYQSILIPLVQFLQTLNLYATIPGLILVHVIYGIPITTLIFRNYYQGVPKELVESGTVDGAGFFGIYRHIVFPISVPAFVVVLIWQFTAVWNEFLFAVTLNSNPSSQPVTVALAGLGASQAGTDYGLQMAGSLITALPTLLVYIFLGRYFIRGLLAGSVKG